MCNVKNGIDSFILFQKWGHTTSGGSESSHAPVDAEDVNLAKRIAPPTNHRPFHLNAEDDALRPFEGAGSKVRSCSDVGMTSQASPSVEIATPFYIAEAVSIGLTPANTSG